MASLVSFEEIQAAVPPVEALMDAMRDAFVALSADRAYVADVSHVHVAPNGGSPGGDACVKSGYVRGADSWVVKVAGGFAGNAALGLSNSQGVMLLFSQKTGALEAVLADGGYLTDVRTAAAAALCVREFKGKDATSLAIFGTGVIAKLVAEYAAPLFPGGELLVVSRSRDSASAFANFAATKGWGRTVLATAADAERGADVIVTCTPAAEPVLTAAKTGALVVALGSDGAGKRELGAGVLAGDPLLLVDSAKQCTAFGEAKHAPDGLAVTELGARLARHVGRDATQTVVCDLTGVAVQDVAIACTVRDAILNAPPAPPADSA